MTEIFEGTAGAALRAGVVEIGDDEHRVRCRPGSFVLGGPDPIEIRVTEQTELGPAEKLADAAWAELEEHPLVADFDEPPGGHVETVLRGVVIDEGERICVAGRVERSTATDGYRGANDAVVRAIDARWIGVGSGAVDWIVQEAERAAPVEPEPKPERTPGEQPSLLPAQVLVVMAVIGFFAAVVLWTRTPIAAAILGYALVFGSLGLFVWRRRRFLPRMLPPFGTEPLRPGQIQGPRSSFHLLWGVGNAGVPVTLLGGFLLIAPSLMTAVEDPRSSVFVFAIVLLVILVQLGFVVVRERRDARLLGVLAKAKPADGDGWGLREGEVVSGGVRRWRTHTREESTSTESYTDDDGRQQTREVTRRWYHGVEHGGAGTLGVRIGAREIQVDVREGALWATTRRSIRELRLDETVKPGDRVLLLGRLEGERTKLGGPESLLLFADESDARRALKQARMHHQLALVAYVVGVAICVATFFV